jgi:hypothetical protein
MNIVPGPRAGSLEATGLTISGGFSRNLKTVFAGEKKRIARITMLALQRTNDI